MKTLTLDAQLDNLSKVLLFIDAQLEAADCGIKAQTQIDIAVEELFVNVANYAYKDKVGEVTVSIDICDRGGMCAVITLTDSGEPYDPLKKPDPDVTLSAEERQIGGLGIYIVKKSMDDVTYEYKDGTNNITIVKRIEM